MTLDFSHRDDNFTASMRFDESVYDYGRDFKNLDESVHWRDRNDRGGSCESKDILDLLPADPFGMDMGATFTAHPFGMDMGATFTALTNWFDVRNALEFVCNNAIKFPSEATGKGFSEADEFDLWFEGLALSSCYGSSSIASSSGTSSGTRGGGCGGVSKGVSEVDKSSISKQSDGEPNEAFYYVLAYLGVRELLSVERVCKALHSAVPSDSLLWRSIYIDQPLNDKIDDNALLHLTARAQGSLKSLSLIKCSKITDNGLKQVLESNPKLEKLIIPGCTRLTIDGIVDSLKDFQSCGAGSLKQLQLGGRIDITQEHFEELKLLLGIDEGVSPKPRIYHGGQLSDHYYDNDDYRVIDIDICPKCENLRLVYDCPLNSCQAKQNAAACRACKLCIYRCFHCGRCVTDVEYDENFSLDVVCLHCGQQQPKVTTTSLCG